MCPMVKPAQVRRFLNTLLCSCSFSFFWAAFLLFSFALFNMHGIPIVFRFPVDSLNLHFEKSGTAKTNSMIVVDTLGIEEPETAHFSQLHRNLYAEMFNSFYVTKTFAKYEVRALPIYELEYWILICQDQRQSWHTIACNTAFLHTVKAQIMPTLCTSKHQEGVC